MNGYRKDPQPTLGAVSQRNARESLRTRFTTGVNLRLPAFQKAYHQSLIVVVRANKQKWTFLLKFMSLYVLSDHQNRLHIDLRAVVYVFVYSSM